MGIFVSPHAPRNWGTLARIGIHWRCPILAVKWSNSPLSSIYTKCPSGGVGPIRSFRYYYTVSSFDPPERRRKGIKPSSSRRQSLMRRVAGSVSCRATFASLLATRRTIYLAATRRAWYGKNAKSSRHIQNMTGAGPSRRRRGVAQMADAPHSQCGGFLSTQEPAGSSPAIPTIYCLGGSRSDLNRFNRCLG